MNLAFAVSTGLLVAVGVFLVLERTTFRVVVGLLVLGYGANFMVALSGGIGGAPPVLDPDVERGPLVVADPLPQALVLTAIVITLGMTLLLLALVVARVDDGGGLEIEPLSDGDDA